MAFQCGGTYSSCSLFLDTELSSQLTAAGTLAIFFAQFMAHDFSSDAGWQATTTFVVTLRIGFIASALAIGCFAIVSYVITCCCIGTWLIITYVAIGFIIGSIWILFGLL